MELASCVIKVFLVLLAVTVCQVTPHPRHLLSLETSTQEEPAKLVEETSIPPPPADGGAKSFVPSEEVGEQLSTVDPVREEGGQNQEKQHGGKMGFGGPPAAADVLEQQGKKPVAGDGGSGEGVTVVGGRRITSCRVCPPGYGVHIPCTATSDTVCAPCPENTFSEGYSARSKCTPCSSCKHGFYQKAPCVADHDVICGACHSHGNGFGNEDFLKECEGAEPPPTPRDKGDGGSGEVDDATLEPGILPFKPTVPIIKNTDGDSTIGEDADIMAVGQPHMGEAQDKSKDQQSQVETGGFQWPVLLAAILSGLIFFVIGILASMWCKRAREQKEREMMYGEGSVRATGLRQSNADYSPSRVISNGYNDADSRSPLNPVQVVYHASADGGSPGQVHWYNSHELFYIDEDSEDEIATNLGRPPSTTYQERRKPGATGPRRSFIQRVRDSPLIARITRNSPRLRQSLTPSRSRYPLCRQPSIGSISSCASSTFHKVGSAPDVTTA